MEGGPYLFRLFLYYEFSGTEKFLIICRRERKGRKFCAVRGGENGRGEGEFVVGLHFGAFVVWTAREEPRRRDGRGPSQMRAELIGARSLRCGEAAWRGAARRVVAGGRGEPLRCCRKKRETKCAAGGKKVNEGSRLRLSEKLLNRERGPPTSQEGTNQS